MPQQTNTKDLEMITTLAAVILAGYFQKVQFVRADNRWYAKYIGTTIEDYMPNGIGLNRWLSMNNEECFLDVCYWTENKINNRKELLRKTQEAKHLPNSPLKIDLENRLNEIESKIPSNKKQWDAHGGNIRLAAFCELLYDKKYFTIKHRMKACAEFALSRYKIDIKASLGGGNHKERRDVLKKHYLEYFK